MVEQDEFRDMMLYASPALRGTDFLCKSGNTVKEWLIQMFIVSQVMLLSLLLTSETSIHLSFDLWTSPNNYSVLGLVCHFIDKRFKARTIILGMQRLYGPHSGEIMAPLIIKVLKIYELGPRLGFCVLDNAGDNDTALRSIQVYLASLGINWNADAHRLRCFGHIINLVANAFTANKPLKPGREPGVPKPIKDPLAPKWTRPDDAITHLHEIVKFITASSQRIEEFQEINQAHLDEDVLQPVRDNDTRWFSVYLMLLRAVKLRNSFDLFVSRHNTPKPREKDLSAHVMTAEDWAYCTDIIQFMQPFFLLVKDLEGKSSTGKSVSLL